MVRKTIQQVAKNYFLPEKYPFTFLTQNANAKKLIVRIKKIKTVSIPISKIFEKTLGFFVPSKIKKLATEMIKEMIAIMMSFFWEVIRVNLTANVQKTQFFLGQDNRADPHAIAVFHFIQIIIQRLKII